MTAAKIIEEIKHLPKQEQAKVVAYVRDLAGEIPGQAQYMHKDTFDSAANEVFEKYDELLRRLSK